MIGLKLGVGIKKDYIHKCVKDDRTEETILKQIEEGLRLENFNRTEYDDYYCYNLNKDILDNELMTFLKRFYELRYIGKSKFESDVVMAKLESCPTIDEKLEILEQRSYQSFQDDKRYGVFYIDESHWYDIPFVSTEIVLSMDGKIMMECYSEVLDFFRRCIATHFSDMKLASSIDVYISD